jgi:hypothetical protein
MTCHLSNQMGIGRVADNAIALKAIQYISCVPLQGEHKTIFGCVKTNKLIFLVKVTLRSSFQQSAILFVTLTLTFHNLPTAECQFSQTWQRKAISRGKVNSVLSYSGIDKILVSHLMDNGNARKLIWLDKAILQIFKLLKKVLCSSYDGVPLKLKRKLAGLHQHRLFELSIDPS